MEKKKMGRPTDNPKPIEIKFRIDETTNSMLKDCSQALRVSKSEILRMGVHKIFDNLEEQP